MNRDELVLTAALTRVNDAITRYVFRVLDEAGGSGTIEYTTPISVVEQALGEQLVTMGQTLLEHTRGRELEVVDGKAIEEIKPDDRPPRKSDISES